MKFRSLLFLLLLIAVTGCCKAGRGGSLSPDDANANIPNGNEDGPLARIYYAFDSSKLDNAAQSTLRSNAEWLKNNPSSKVTVEGHCDERGTNEYNMALGERRAKSAFDFLRSLGVDGSRLSTISYGEEIPAVAGHDEAAWAKNRRAQFKVAQ